MEIFAHLFYAQNHYKNELNTNVLLPQINNKFDAFREHFLSLSEKLHFTKLLNMQNVPEYCLHV